MILQYIETERHRSTLQKICTFRLFLQIYFVRLTFNCRSLNGYFILDDIYKLISARHHYCAQRIIDEETSMFISSLPKQQFRQEGVGQYLVHQQALGP